jgi:hypothetical protein
VLAASRLSWARGALGCFRRRGPQPFLHLKLRNAATEISFDIFDRDVVLGRIGGSFNFLEELTNYL